MSIKDEGANRNALSRRNILLGTTTLAAASAFAAGTVDKVAQAQQAAAPASGSKPNIVVIWGDDIGITDLSAYSLGLMGFHTPNIDRVAREGMIFTDYYGEQSCTAGRSAFITGQSVFRTGMSKVGLPGASLGLQKEDPTIAELLKPLGYATGQFGKNHLGDRNEYLPTVHGFDEFYGNLYHLNAEEEPELPDYPNPKDFPNFRERFGPRGVLHSFATDVDDPTVDPRFGRVGKQKIEDTGPLTKKRMETIDDDIADRASGFIEAQAKANKPFFVWVNFTHMHFRTHAKPSSVGQAGRWQDAYHDVMIDHDNGQPDIWLMHHCMTRGSLAIDIGASIGLYSRELAKCAKHVVAFEANPRAAEFARLVVPSNVTVESVALSSADGEMTLRIPLNQRRNTVDDLGTIEPKNTLQAHAIASQMVKTKKLDDYGFTDCGFIKIDVEGHEEAVLDGGIRLIESSRPILMIELDDSLRPGIVGRVRERLGAFGYAAFEFQDGRLQAIGQDKRSLHRNLLFVPRNTRVPALSCWDRFGHAIRARVGH